MTRLLPSRRTRATATVWLRPGTVERRRTTKISSGQYVIHLIDFTEQNDTDRDAPRNKQRSSGDGSRRVRRSGSQAPRVRRHRMPEIDLVVDGDYLAGRHRWSQRWQTVLVEQPPSPSVSPAAGQETFA